MTKVQIYTTGWCPYCNAAKSLLADKGVAYEEIDASDPNVREDMIQRAHGRRTIHSLDNSPAHGGSGDPAWKPGSAVGENEDNPEAKPAPKEQSQST